MTTKSLNEFLNSGKLPPSIRERSALLDDLRSQLLSQKTKNMNYTLADGKPINSAEIAKLNAKAAAERAARASVKNAKEQLANAKTARAAAAAELSKLTGRPTPAPTRRASVPVATAKPSPAPVKPALTTAAAFAGPPLVMTRDEFQKLSASDKSRFLKSGGKLA